MSVDGPHNHSHVCCLQRLANQAPGSAESEKEFLSYLSPLSTTLKVMTTLKLLSSHSDEEQYLLAEQETLGWLTVGQARGGCLGASDRCMTGTSYCPQCSSSTSAFIGPV